MFKTEETRRVRSRYGKPGTRVHDVPVPHTKPMTTSCGKPVRLFDARDRVHDLPLSASEDIPVTCPACVRAVAESTQTPPIEGDQVT